MPPEVTGPRRTPPPSSRIAVALHDIEPATFARCALMRDWLHDLGVGKVTLLVIPAGDLHPLHDRSPELARWLGAQVDGGDAVAQHGFQHRRGPAGPRAARAVPRGQRAREAEFVGLDAGEARRAVAAGRRVLKLAGVEPLGFVAPAYAYTPALERALAESFSWWASVTRLSLDHGRRTAPLPALTLPGPDAGPGDHCRWPRVRSRRRTGPLLRVDLHPGDLEVAGRIASLERVLRRAGRREAVTYDDLALGA